MTMQEGRVGRGLHRSTYFYYHQNSNQATRHVTQMAFCRESCSDSGDSGVCLDSGSEPSQSSPNLDTRYPDWRAVPNYPASGSTSSLKIRKGDCTTKKPEKPLKVRFADVGPVPDSEPPSPPPLPPPPGLKYYYVVRGTSRNPPPYEVALDRIQEINLKQRSASLAREHPRRDYCSSTVPRLEITTRAIRPENYDPSTSKELNFSTFPRNLSRRPGRSQSESTITRNSRNPGIMPAGSCDDIVQLESVEITNKRQTKPKFALCVTSALQKFANHALNKLGSQERIILSGDTTEIDVPVINCKDTERSPGVCDPLPDNVKARLMGIDNKGVHVVELRKLAEGPFGFYISTGTFKRKKGVYVSRVTVRNLHNLLNVGDQILQIDNVSVKGKTLEQVQSMMIDKDKVLLKILPLLS